jgi:integration host factor subunit beta
MWGLLHLVGSSIVIIVHSRVACDRARDRSLKLPLRQRERTKMTKSQLIALLVQRYPQYVVKDVEAAVKTIHDAMAQALKEGKRIEIRGFGSFCLNHRPPRVGRNPKSGETVRVPEKYTPHFKAGKELRQRVDATAPRPAMRD